MNWKVKLVLLFGRLRKPVEGGEQQIGDARRKANSAARLGSLLFDSKVPVAEVKDLNADGIPARVYRNGPEAAKPLIVYYHGGGFMLYGLDSHDLVCRRLCALCACTVVAVDYRLAPEHTFPAAHEDAWKALCWVRNHAATLGGSAEELVVMGDSAGGNLAACMAHRAKKEGIALKAQVLIYPWVDGRLQNPSIDRNGKGYLLTKEAIFWFQRQYTPRPEDRCLPAVSPCFEPDSSGLAPAFILTAELDPLLDDGYNYARQLINAGNKVLYKEYKGLFHSFFNLPKVDAGALQAYTDIHNFLNPGKTG